MNLRVILFLIIGFFAPFLHTDVYGQTAASKKADSLKAAREHVADSLRIARTRIADSIKVTRQHRTDSINSVRKRKADSIAFVAKYKNSKKYKDSVAKARKGKPAIAKGTSATARGGGTSASASRDSLTEPRKAISDSIATSRKARTDSIRTVQKRRADSIGRVQKYKTSKRYADSVAIARRTRSDSVKAVQQHTRDSIAAIRKQSMDSAKAVRLHSTDSIKSVRTRYTDSLKVVRKAKTDSLAKVKAGKDKLVKAKEKKKEEDIKLKLELKIKQKREEWSNKKMLKKPWTPVRRFTQNAFTHYNYYYNANRKMDEAEVNMQRARKESYDSLIYLFPFDPNKDSSLMAADMDSIIHKVSVGLQIHDPRVKWSGDMYLILGKAYYYKGNYENAAIAFRYIIAEDEAAKKKKGLKKKGDVSIVNEENKSMLSFLQHQSVHNDAILWLARVYSTANQEENASSILSLLESDAKLPESLKGRVAIEKAFSYIRQNNYDAASEQLDLAIEDKSLPNWQRQRAAFLNGQILQNKGDYVAAANSFERVLDFYPKIEMDFYARKNVAYNRLMASNDASVAMAPLKKMLSDGKYATYYDQVYYVLGKLAQKADRTEEAIQYFSKSASTPKATKKQKALSFAALGDVYYATAKYPSAKRAYDSASKYSSGGPKDRDVAVTAAVQRSKALTEISAPGKVIHDQDSLLALAAKSKKEQVAVVRDYLRRLEKEKEDSAANAEAAGVASARDEASEAGGDASSWYFSNPTLMQQGSADFKRKWGTRPLVDNWRRSAALTFVSSGGSKSSSGGAEEETATAQDFSLPTEDNLLAKIPNTAQQKENAVKQIQKAYLQMAKAYFNQLDDYNRTLNTLDTLNIRYPSHSLKEDELYLRYQVAVKQNQLDKAQAISQDLITRFPNSQYANLLKPSVSESTLAGAKAAKEVADYFDETYRLLQQQQYTEVLVRIDAAKKQYNHPRFKKRFEVLEASAYAGQGEYKVADSLLRGFLKANAADTLAVWAKNVQDYVIQMKDNGKPAWYDEAVAIAAASAAKATEAKAPDVAGVTKPVAPPPPPPAPEAPRFYSPQPDSEHYSIIVFPGLDSRTAGLKQSVKRLDSAKYASAGHQLLIDFYDMTQGVMIIKSFENAAAVKIYNEELMASPAFSAYKEGELKILAISRQNYKKMFSDKDAQPYFNFYNNNYR